MQQKARQTEGKVDEARDFIVNGERCRSTAGSLAELVQELGYGERRIATAVNGQFVSASARDQIDLSDGDRIEIVAPRQGG